MSDRDIFLNKYLAQVEWLAEHDQAAVDAAVRLERDSANAPSIDKEDAEQKAQIRSAISLLASHVRIQRQGQLTPAAVTADTDQLNIGGAK